MNRKIEVGRFSVRMQQVWCRPRPLASLYLRWICTDFFPPPPTLATKRSSLLRKQARSVQQQGVVDYQQTLNLDLGAHHPALAMTMASPSVPPAAMATAAPSNAGAGANEGGKADVPFDHEAARGWLCVLILFTGI